MFSISCVCHDSPHILLSRVSTTQSLMLMVLAYTPGVTLSSRQNSPQLTNKRRVSTELTNERRLSTVLTNQRPTFT